MLLLLFSIWLLCLAGKGRRVWGIEPGSVWRSAVTKRALLKPAAASHWGTKQANAGHWPAHEAT